MGRFLGLMINSFQNLITSSYLRFQQIFTSTLFIQLVTLSIFLIFRVHNFLFLNLYDSELGDQIASEYSLNARWLSLWLILARSVLSCNYECRCLFDKNIAAYATSAVCILINRNTRLLVVLVLGEK